MPNALTIVLDEYETEWWMEERDWFRRKVYVVAREFLGVGRVEVVSVTGADPDLITAGRE